MLKNENILALSGKEPTPPKSPFLIACEQIQNLIHKYTSLNLKIINLEEKLNNIELIPGPKGEIGDKGEKGEIGIQGITGDIGPKGENGERGETGAIGLSGNDGKDGEKGDTGEKGEPGNIGLKGEDGVKGEDGKDGVDGSPGIQGERGDIGERGETGPQGEKGEKGDSGRGIANAKLEDGFLILSYDDETSVSLGPIVIHAEVPKQVTKTIIHERDPETKMIIKSTVIEK